jgi:tetratricopeptide (TPR) repeat protein
MNKHFSAKKDKSMAREFIDKNRPVAMKYYNLCEEYDGSNSKSTISALNKLIKEDSHFLDSYNLLAEIYDDLMDTTNHESAVVEAGKKGLELILGEQGKWPSLLEWGFLENRHIIRAILNLGIHYWQKGENDKALEIFRNLLRSNLNDNIGARDFILAIRSGMSCRKFHEKFDRGGYFDSDLTEWFEKESKNFPDEFKEFFQHNE